MKSCLDYSYYFSWSLFLLALDIFCESKYEISRVLTGLCFDFGKLHVFIQVNKQAD